MTLRPAAEPSPQRTQATQADKRQQLLQRREQQEQLQLQRREQLEKLRQRREKESQPIQESPPEPATPLFGHRERAVPEASPATYGSSRPVRLKPASRPIPTKDTVESGPDAESTIYARVDVEKIRRLQPTPSQELVAEPRSRRETAGESTHREPVHRSVDPPRAESRAETRTEARTETRTERRQPPPKQLSGLLEELSLLKTVLLQACYLNATAEKAFIARQNLAERYLFSAWQRVQKLKQGVEEEQTYLAHDEYLLLLHQNVVQQQEILQWYDLLKAATTKDSVFSASLYRTTHTLPTSRLTVDLPNLASTLERSLPHVEMLRKGTSALEPGLSEVSSSYASLKDNVGQQVSELETCKTQVDSLAQMANYESSLRVGITQLLTK